MRDENDKNRDAAAEQMLDMWQRMHREGAEFFVDGEDCVMFGSEEDMLGKIEYYLTHDTEREEIACNGFRKVRERYSCEVLADRVLKIVFER